MKDIISKLNEGKGLPKLRKLKNTPDWIQSYPDFVDNLVELWDDDKELFVQTLMYFMTGQEDCEDMGLSTLKMMAKDLYHD